MFRLSKKKMLMGLLIRIANASNQTKCISLSDEKCMTQPTHINLHPNILMKPVKIFTTIHLQLN